MSKPNSLHGVYAPTLTPVHEDLSPDADRWIAHCKRLLNSGCHGLVPFGTTSEANSFSAEERMALLEQLVAAGVSPTQLIVGTGMCAFPDSVRLTDHAVKLGCAGVLMLPPFFYKGMSDEGLFRTIAEIIQRVGDDRLQIYLYHIPPVAQVGYSISLIDRFVRTYPDTVVGIKDSSSDWNNLHNILTNFPDFTIFSGTERFLLQALRMGGAGTITAMANVAPQTIRTLYDHWESENADALQEEANRTRAVVSGYPVIPALKSIIAFEQDDPAWKRVRPPFVELPDAQAGELLAQLGLHATI